MIAAHLARGCVADGGRNLPRHGSKTIGMAMADSTHSAAESWSPSTQARPNGSRALPAKLLIISVLALALAGCARNPPPRETSLVHREVRTPVRLVFGMARSLQGVGWTTSARSPSPRKTNLSGEDTCENATIAGSTR